MPRWRALALALLVAVATAPGVSAQERACEPEPFHALFVLNVGGAAELGYGDVHIIENLTEALKRAYCVGDDRITVLLDDGQWRADGGHGPPVGDAPYAPATEANVQAALEAAGRGLADAPPGEGRFFMMLSSHGNVYSKPVAGHPCTERRAAASGGSIAFLNDATLADCELAQMLNDTIPRKAQATLMFDCSYCGGFGDAFSPTKATDNSAGVVAPNRQVLVGCTMTTECYQRPGGAQFYMLWWEGVATGAADGFAGSEFGDPVVPEGGAGDGVVTAEEAYWFALAEAREDGDALSVQASFQKSGELPDPFKVRVLGAPGDGGGEGEGGGEGGGASAADL